MSRAAAMLLLALLKSRWSPVIFLLDAIKLGKVLVANAVNVDRLVLAVLLVAVQAAAVDIVDRAALAHLVVEAVAVVDPVAPAVAVAAEVEAVVTAEAEAAVVAMVVGAAVTVVAVGAEATTCLPEATHKAEDTKNLRSAVHCRTAVKRRGGRLSSAADLFRRMADENRCDYAVSRDVRGSAR
ncbi:MAG TPA: hypothetical protein VF773_09420 [Verrucomicrobiae bacterium]